MMKQVKALFLDIDGVLNCDKTGYSPLGVRDIDGDKLLLLKRVIEATKAKIFLISSWKDGWFSSPKKKPMQSATGDYLDHRFAEVGLKIYGKVPDVDFGGRGKSILEFQKRLSRKGYLLSPFAIVDDEAGDYAKMGLSDHWVKTSFLRGGLTQKAADKIIDLLNEPKR